jgi:hypothetical protein
VKRFSVGLFAGTFSAVVTWALSQHAVLTVCVGLFVALVIWFWTVVDAIIEGVSAVVEVVLGALLK